MFFHALPMTQLILMIVAGFLAGCMNTVAGGGSFITFPTLLFLGVPPIIANATNTTAMWMGTFGTIGGYREELKGHYKPLIPAMLVGVAGGLLGAWLLLSTPELVFTRMIPWLMLTATVIFASSSRLRKLAGSKDHPGLFAPVTLVPLFFVGIYGGYFGAAIGILTLALLALSGVTEIHRANGIKAILSFVVNGVAFASFVVAGKIEWPIAMVLSIAAILGAYVAARISRKVSAKALRQVVIGIGVALTLYYFWKTYIHH